MSYKKAAHLLPADLLKEVQKYVDGTCIYIPRADAHKRSWGADTSIRRELNALSAPKARHPAECAGASDRLRADHGGL